MTTLQKHILEIQQGIKIGQFSNEATIAQGIVLRLLQALSWPTYSTIIVAPKYEISSNRFDYVLCSALGKPMVIIEINDGNLGEEQESQILAKAHDAAVPLALITDGREWQFYITSNQDYFKKIPFCKLDLLENSVGEIVQYLDRYLAYDTVCTGNAYENALSDNKFKENRIFTDVSATLSKLFKEGNQSFVSLITKEIENAHGYRPDEDTVRKYLPKLPKKEIGESQSQISHVGTPRAGKFFFWFFFLHP